MAASTSPCCSSETMSNGDADPTLPGTEAGAVTKKVYRNPVTTARPAMSTAVVAASGSRGPRCG